MSGQDVPHDALRYLIALKAKDVFGVSCIALQEVPAMAAGEPRALLRRADLVLVTEMAPYPYVRVIEVKTRAEDVWKAFEQIQWFKEKGLANYYFVALPKKECDEKLHWYGEFYNRNIGLIVIDARPTHSGLEADVEIRVKPNFEIRRTDWDELYRELEKQGKHRLVERLRNTVGKTPVG